jgi:RHS repeat-associated protein
MPGRNYQSSTAYRFGFNGKENDIEVIGTGSGTQDYGMRIYNPALGRFLSVDPLAKSFPFYTPYQFAGNKPIAFVDLDGLEDVYNLILIINKEGTTQIKAYNHFLVGSKKVGAESSKLYLLTTVINGVTVHQYVSRAIFHKAAENVGMQKHVNDGRNMFEYWSDEATLQLQKNNDPVKVNESGPGGSSSDPWGINGLHGNTNPQVTNDPEAAPGPGSSAESKELVPTGWDGQNKQKTAVTRDKDGFIKLGDGTWRKDFEGENYLYKDKNGKDTTVMWNGTPKKYDNLSTEEKKEISTWTPIEKK